jgi:hypothetical protein
MRERQKTGQAAARKEDGKFYFMICNTCFWCASVFKLHLSKYRDMFSCPVCKGSKIETIPLAANKMHNLKLSESSRRVVLDSF